MKYDVFISYSHKDKQTADAVCAKLEQQGIRCWYAPRDIAPGAEWASAIIEAIESCRAFVLIFTDYSNASPQVLREITAAVDKELPIIPYKLTETTPSKGMQYYLGAVHWLDAMNVPMNNSISVLAERVKSVLGPRTAPDIRPEDKTEQVSSGSSNGGQDRKAGWLPYVLAGIIVLLAAVILWQAGVFGGGSPEPTAAPLTEANVQEETYAPDEQEPAPDLTEEPAAEPTEKPEEAPTAEPTEEPATEPAETPEAEENIVEWENLGRIQVKAADWEGDYTKTFPKKAKPEGKWVLVILDMLDTGTITPGNATKLSELVRLDAYMPSSYTTTSARDGGTATMALFYDVPEDYDVSGGIVTVDGVEVIHGR